MMSAPIQISENAMERRAERAETTTGREPSTSPSSSLAAALREDMAYADFRTLALEHGWMPLFDPANRANVVGAHASICIEFPDLHLCKICDLLPELAACSGQGDSLMRFTHPADHRVLEVAAYGMTEDWDVHGEDARLRLVGWCFVEDHAR